MRDGRGREGIRLVNSTATSEEFVEVWADGAWRGFDAGRAFEGCEHESALGFRVVSWFGFGGLCRGPGVFVLVLFENESCAAEPGERVEGANVVGWVVD